jgi:excisionase family DNA binding protein
MLIENDQLQESQPHQTRTKVEHFASGFYSVAEVAQRLGVHRLTVSRWCKSGKIPAFEVRFGCKVTYKIAVSAVQSLFLASGDRKEQIARGVNQSQVNLQPQNPPVHPRPSKPIAIDYNQELAQWVAAMANGGFNGKVYSPLTIEYYAGHIKAFLSDYSSLSWESVQRCFLAIPKEAYAKRFKLYKALVSFSKWLIQKGLLSSQLLEQLHSLKPKRHQPPVQNVLSEEEARQLWSVLKTPEEQAFVGIMLGTGLRVSELVALTWADIDLTGLSLSVKKGKGVKSRKVGVTYQLWEVLINYQCVVSPTAPNQPVFKDTKGKALSRVAIGKRLERIGQRVGLKVSPHALRRTFVTINANKGRPLQMIQLACGHSDIKTTMGYCKTREEEVINAMKDW